MLWGPLIPAPNLAQTIGSLTVKCSKWTTKKNQGSIPGHLALWVGAVGAPHSSTHGYYVNVVRFILDPHYLLGLTCISVMHDVLEES